MIREASLEDVPTIAELGERFHEEAGWQDITRYVRQDCEKSLAHMVESLDGILLVAERDGRIVGMAGGLAYPFYFNHAHKSGQELFWWIEPGGRDGLGGKLLDRLEEDARKRGCLSWSMVALAKIEPELMGRLYRRRGYRASENTWIKRL